MGVKAKKFKQPTPTKKHTAASSASDVVHDTATPVALKLPNVQKDSFVSSLSSNTFKYALVFALAVGIFHNSLNGDFTYDDAFAIRNNADATGQNPLSSIWVHDYWGTELNRDDSHKSYRPLTILTFRLNYFIHNMFFNTTASATSPDQQSRFGYESYRRFMFEMHIVNVILHAVVSCQVIHLASLVFSTEAAMPTLAAGILFAVHPIHTEAVSGLVGRAEPLSAMFVLAAFSMYETACRFDSIKHTLYSLLLIWTALLCKETAYAYFGVFIVWDVLHQPRVCQSIIDFITRRSGLRFLRPALPTFAVICSYCKGPHHHSLHKQLRTLPPSLSAALVQNSPDVCQPGSSVYSLLAPASSTPNSKKQRLPFFNGSFLLRVFIVFVAAASYLLLRRSLAVNITLNNFRRLENPIAFSQGLTKYLSNAYLHARYAWLLLVPYPLSADYSFECWPLVESWTDLRNLAALALYASLLGLCVLALKHFYSTGRQILFVLVLMAFPFLPASNLFFWVGTMLGERLLYLPSVGYCLLVAYLLWQVSLLIDRNADTEDVTHSHHSPSSSSPFSASASPSSAGKVETVNILRNSTNTTRWSDTAGTFAAFLLLLLLVNVYGAITLARNRDWENEERLFQKAEEVCPRSGKVQYNLGLLALEGENWSEARRRFDLVREIVPESCELDNDYAVLALKQQGNPAEAIRLFRKAIHCKYTLVKAMENLHKIYSALLAMQPDEYSLLEDWGDIYAEIEKYPEAYEHYVSCAHGWNKLNRTTAARRCFLKAAKVYPPGPLAHIWLAEYAIQDGDVETAVKEYLAATERDTEYKVYGIEGALRIFTDPSHRQKYNKEYNEFLLRISHLRSDQLDMFMGENSLDPTPLVKT